jgi:hypothetical protein
MIMTLAIYVRDLKIKFLLFDFQLANQLEGLDQRGGKFWVKL